GGGGAAPVLVHAPGGPQAQFEELGLRVEEVGDPLAGGEAPLVVLLPGRLGAAALFDALLLLAEGLHQLGQVVAHGHGSAIGPPKGAAPAPLLGAVRQAYSTEGHRGISMNPLDLVPGLLFTVTFSGFGIVLVYYLIRSMLTFRWARGEGIV